MEMLQLAGPAQKSGTTYSATAAVLCDVIALSGALIARERGSVRPDLRCISRWQTSRDAAVAACHRLGTEDIESLDRLQQDFRATRIELLRATSW